jgi:transposase-like protein
MKRRKWDEKLKAKIVIEGLQGRSVAELCNEYQIGQNLYYRWRDQFLANAERAFRADKPDRHAERLAQENRRLKGVIGDLTLELKKNDW